MQKKRDPLIILRGVVMLMIGEEHRRANSGDARERRVPQIQWASSNVKSSQ